MTNDGRALSIETTLHNQTRQRLVETFPGLLDDDECLSDTLEGMTNLREIILQIAETALMDAKHAKVCTERAAELHERAARLKARCEKKRAAIAHAMAEAALRKIPGATLLVSLSAAPEQLRVIDESQIPEDYFTQAPPPPPALDKRALLADLKAGKKVPGAETANGAPRLTIRTA